MAKYVEKKIEIDAEQFDSSKPVGDWPIGVQANVLSPTGFSYGTLAEIQAPMGPGYVMIDGFPIKNLDFLVTDCTGKKYALSVEEFNKRFELK